MKKRKKFLIIYFIIIVVIVVVLFLLPNSLFKKKEEDLKSFVAFEIQKQHLLNDKYSYKYFIQFGNDTYKCEGKRNKDKNKGECSSPKKITYDENNYEQVFSKINMKLLDVNYIFDLIKETEEKIETYGKTRRYIYNVSVNKHDVLICIYTNYADITKISIEYEKVVYILDYSDLEY